MRFYRRELPLALILIGAMSAGCGAQVTSKSRPAFSDQWEAEYLAADRQFAAEVNAAAAADRARIWATWFAADGRQLIPGRMVQGPESITDLMTDAFDTPAYSLTWVPDQAVVSAAGDLGWTSGRYQNTSQGPDGPVLAKGRYLTIWRRQADGTLKVDLDTGMPDER